MKSHFLLLKMWPSFVSEREYLFCALALLFPIFLSACSIDASIESTNSIAKPSISAPAGNAVISEERVVTTLGTSGYTATGRLYDVTEKLTTTLGTAGYTAEGYVQ